MNKIQKHLYQYCVPGQIHYLAVSGGVDSMVLLHAAYMLRDQFDFYILHVNHQLQTCANDWVALIAHYAECYQIPYKVLNVLIEGEKNLEARCRKARYQALQSMVGEKGVLMTAHHQDDQTETFLFRLFRGSSLHGLTGMASRSVCFDLNIIRPFLKVRKKDIYQYALYHQLKYIDDPSNEDHRFARNSLRYFLKSFPHQKGLRVSMNHIARQQKLLIAVIDQYLIDIQTRYGSLKLNALCEYDVLWQEELFYHWLLSYLPGLSQKHVQTLFESIHKGKDVAIPINSSVMISYRGLLTIVNLPLLYDEYSGQDVALAIGIGVLDNPKKEWVSIKPLKHHGQYKKRFQDLGLPAIFREYLPVMSHPLSCKVADHLMDYEKAILAAIMLINS